MKMVIDVWIRKVFQKVADWLYRTWGWNKFDLQRAMVLTSGICVWEAFLLSFYWDWGHWLAIDWVLLAVAVAHTLPVCFGVLGSIAEESQFVLRGKTYEHNSKSHVVTRCLLAAVASVSVYTLLTVPAAGHLGPTRYALIGTLVTLVAGAYFSACAPRTVDWALSSR